MNKVFIGGSRHIFKLSVSVRERIDKIIERGLPIVIGDANGVDKAAQQYLFGKRYEKVDVFCSGEICRNNLGHWPLRRIETNTRGRSAIFHASKDRAMTQEASYGLMVWDGKSVGTLMNVQRLTRQNKKVVVYNAATENFSELSVSEQWERFIAPFDPDLRLELEKKAALEERTYQNQDHRLFHLVPSR